MPKNSTIDHKPRILLLSAYDADSHKSWRGRLVQGLNDFHWTELSLPARYFSWRVRGNSLSWAFEPEYRETLEAPYDLVIATSMVDLSALRGFVPALARVPNVVYFHENQFSYPENNRQHGALEPQLLSIYSALCADKLWFNSDFNRQSFFDGAQALLKKLPDCVPKGLLTQLSGRSQCLAVPLSHEWFEKSQALFSDQHSNQQGSDQQCDQRSTLTLVWNHRWEHDKGPERLLACAQELIDRGIDFRLHVLGQSFRKQPVEFGELKRLLAEHNRLGHWGYLPSKDDYRHCLAQADIVLSTALHDFQGLAVLEAVAQGCIPVLPKRQVYPEWFSDEFLYSVDTDVHREVQSMVDRIIDLTNKPVTLPSVAPFDERQLLHHYREAIQALVN